MDLTGVTRQAPTAAWLAWSSELRACLEEHDIPTDRTFDDLSFFRAETIELDGSSAEGALLCARGAVVVHGDDLDEGTLRHLLALAYVGKQDKQRATDACGTLAGPRCGTTIELENVAPVEPPAQARAWYADTAACLAELGIALRYEFDELTFWSTPSIEVGAVCSGGALVLPEGGASERVVRYAMVTANTDAADQEHATATCVDALIAP